MCGRFAQYTALERLQEIFGIDTVTCGQIPDYNTAPSQEVLAVIEHEGERRMGVLSWGLIPFWSENPSEARRPINARSETAHEKPTFRHAFQSQRCLILADGFYEWQKTADGPKQPFFIQIPSRGPFAFAGLWDIWKDNSNGNPPSAEQSHTENRIRSCTILTTASAGPLRKIHDRMPVVLKPHIHDAWLDPDFQDVEGVKQIMQENRVADFVAHPVSRRVNSVKNQGEDLIKPIPPGTPSP